MVSLEFFIHIILIAVLLPWGRCVELTTLPPSCAECLEIWETDSSGTLRACAIWYRDCFTVVIFGASCVIITILASHIWYVYSKRSVKKNKTDCNITAV